jgi:DNA-binding transcriptional ArsR family regulator
MMTAPGDSMSSASPAGADVASIADFTAFFKAFCNATRAGIVEQLMSGEKCVCEIAAHVGGSQPLVSHHLATLRNAGFVTMRGEGARTYYAIDWENFDERLRSFGETTRSLREQDAGPSCACG